MNEGELADVLAGQLPDMQERTRLVREVGDSISNTWGGSVSKMIQAATEAPANWLIWLPAVLRASETPVFTGLLLVPCLRCPSQFFFQGSTNFSAEACSNICS